MPGTRNILVLGASYGSLLGMKLALAGHNTHLICLPAEADLINSEGAVVRMPLKGRDGLVELRSRAAQGKLTAGGPLGVDPSRYDLAALAMQEPQYRQSDVRALMDRVAASRVPVMSIMNMPPLPYLARIPGLDTTKLRGCFTEPAIWDAFDPKLFTLCSPDPQAFRPPEEPANVLQVRLPTNFKAARFDDARHTQILRDLEADVDAVRVSVDGVPREIPVKLKVHDSLYVPLAKWAMLLAGNYRCVGKDGMRPIKEAIHSDLAQSRSVYGWVVALCQSLGASADDMVPFDKYAAAAQSLGSPSSAARALAAGAVNIERVDMLVQQIGKSRGQSNEAVDATVALVDSWLDRNRKAAAAKA